MYINFTDVETLTNANVPNLQLDHNQNQAHLQVYVLQMRALNYEKIHK